jgi:hypothetical protein
MTFLKATNVDEIMTTIDKLVGIKHLRLVQYMPNTTNIPIIPLSTFHSYTFDGKPEEKRLIAIPMIVDIAYNRIQTAIKNMPHTHRLSNQHLISPAGCVWR